MPGAVEGARPEKAREKQDTSLTAPSSPMLNPSDPRIPPKAKGSRRSIRLSFGKVQSQVTRFVVNNRKQLARAELYLTAALSIVDMISDVAMCVRYTQKGNTSYAVATITCLSANLFFTALGSYLIYRNTTPFQAGQRTDLRVVPGEAGY